jgi:hypothetical protein
VSALLELKSVLGFEEATAVQFGAIADLLSSMGVAVVAPLMPLRQGSMKYVKGDESASSSGDTRFNTL